VSVIYDARAAKLRTVSTSSLRSGSKCDYGTVSTATVSPTALNTSTE
jgi:hypothetical protein